MRRKELLFKKAVSRNLGRKGEGRCSMVKDKSALLKGQVSHLGQPEKLGLYFTSVDQVMGLICHFLVVVSYLHTFAMVSWWVCVCGGGTSPPFDFRLG